MSLQLKTIQEVNNFKRLANQSKIIYDYTFKKGKYIITLEHSEKNVEFLNELRYEF